MHHTFRRLLYDVREGVGVCLFLQHLVDFVEVYDAPLAPIDILPAFHVQLVKYGLDVLPDVASLG